MLIGISCLLIATFGFMNMWGDMDSNDRALLITLLIFLAGGGYMIYSYQAAQLEYLRQYKDQQISQLKIESNEKERVSDKAILALVEHAQYTQQFLPDDDNAEDE